MNHVIDNEGNPILDENNNKIEYFVNYINTDDWYKHREPIHLNDDGHLDTENRYLIIKEGIQPNHSITKSQLDLVDTSKYSKEEIDNKLSALQNTINNVVQNSMKTLELKILTQMINFRNEQIKNRIGRKNGKIPKKTHIIHELLNKKDIGDIEDLNEIMITNVYIKRLNWFFDSKSSHAESSFKNTFELMFNKEMTTYNCFFTHFDNFWDLSYIIEWIVIPKKISADNENNENNENKYVPEIHIANN